MILRLFVLLLFILFNNVVKAETLKECLDKIISKDYNQFERGTIKDIDKFLDSLDFEDIVLKNYQAKRNPLLDTVLTAINIEGEVYLSNLHYVASKLNLDFYDKNNKLIEKKITRSPYFINQLSVNDLKTVIAYHYKEIQDQEKKEKISTIIKHNIDKARIAKLVFLSSFKNSRSQIYLTPYGSLFMGHGYDLTSNESQKEKNLLGLGLFYKDLHTCLENHHAKLFDHKQHVGALEQNILGKTAAHLSTLNEMTYCFGNGTKSHEQHLIMFQNVNEFLKRSSNVNYIPQFRGYSIEEMLTLTYEGKLPLFFPVFKANKTKIKLQKELLHLEKKGENSVSNRKYAELIEKIRVEAEKDFVNSNNSKEIILHNLQEYLYLFGYEYQPNKGIIYYNKDSIAIRHFYFLPTARLAESLSEIVDSLMSIGEKNLALDLLTLLRFDLFSDHNIKRNRNELTRKIVYNITKSWDLILKTREH